MQRYILKRLVEAVITVLGVTVIVFLLVRITGDPRRLILPPEATAQDWEAMGRALGLDRPIYVQYFHFIRDMFRGDFGQSIYWQEPTLEIFLARFPNTLLLALAAMGFASVIGIPVGIWSAVRVGGWFDRFGKIVAMLGQSLPTFWVGIMLIFLLGAKYRLLPTSGTGGPDHLVLPAFTLGWYFMAAQARLTRSSMLDVLDSEYIKLARIKGLPEVNVILKHALKNALLPVVTLSAINFVVILGGAIVTEVVFSWPGVGRLVVDSIFARDYPVVQTSVFIFALIFVSMSLLVDVLYTYLDPRIRYQ